MKLYRSVKKVYAFKFEKLHVHAEVCDLVGRGESGQEFRVRVDTGWAEQHKPQVGDYIVTYENGYVSRNIAEVFEKEHTLIVSLDDGSVEVNANGHPYLSSKIVCAGEIEFWGDAEIDTRFVPIVRAQGGIVKELAPVEADRIFQALKEIHPKATKWLVIYSNGYVSVSPGIQFEEGYVPLTV